MLDRSKKAYVLPIAMATLHFSLGETDEGFEALDKAYEEHDFRLSYLKIGQAFESVRSDPRYAAMLKKIGLEE